MTDSATVVQGMAAGVGGAVLALLGADAQTLTAALFGCGLGAMRAPVTGRVRSALVFAAAVAASAIAASILGPLLASWMPVLPGVTWAKASALLVGILLHPLIQAASTAVPRVVDAAMAYLEKKTQ